MGSVFIQIKVWIKGNSGKNKMYATVQDNKCIKHIRQTGGKKRERKSTMGWSSTGTWVSSARIWAGEEEGVAFPVGRWSGMKAEKQEWGICVRGPWLMGWRANFEAEWKKTLEIEGEPSSCRVLCVKGVWAFPQAIEIHWKLLSRKKVRQKKFFSRIIVVKNEGKLDQNRN